MRFLAQTLLAIVMGTSLISSCSPKGEQPPAVEIESHEETVQDDSSEDITAMTEQEINLLSAVYPNESMIQDGKLFEYQKETLRQLRLGTDYLQTKYPNTNFTVTSITPATKFEPWMTIAIKTQDGKEAKATVELENDDYIFADTLYGIILRKDYDALLQNLLAQENVRAVTFTDFYAPMDKRIDKNTTPEELLEMNDELPRNTHIFIREPELAETKAVTVKRIKSLITDREIYGAYTIYFAPEDISEDAEVMMNSKDQFEHETFNTFAGN